MGEVPVMFNGVLFPKNKKDKPQAVCFVGHAWIPGLHPDNSLPIPPPIVDNTLPGPEPHPEHPIALPPEPPNGGAPPPDGGIKPPPPEGGWGYHPEYGWGYFPGPSGPQPH